MVVVLRSVEVGGHGGVIGHPILPAVMLLHLQAGDLADIDFIRRLQGGRQESGLRHGLMRQLGVDA